MRPQRHHNGFIGLESLAQLGFISGPFGFPPLSNPLVDRGHERIGDVLPGWHRRLAYAFTVISYICN